MTATTTRRGVMTRAVAALAVVALVLGAVVGALAVLGDDDPSPAAGEPAPLSLTRTVTGLSTGGGPLVGGDDLPAGPSEGVVLDPSGSSVTEAQVAELLDALGLAAEPEQVDGGWRAEGRVAPGVPAAFALDESAGNLWQLATGADVGCMAVSPGGFADQDAASCSAAPDPAADDRPTRRQLLRLAEPVFDAVGVRPGEGLRALPGDGTLSMDVPLEVEELPVAGVNLSVTAAVLGQGPALTSAIGWLRPSFEPVGPYPLVGAEQALATLQAQPVPEIATCEQPTGADGRPRTDAPCRTPEPVEVTGARLAWMTSFDGSRTLLVPAWQLETDGLYGPAAVAVAPSHLAPPP